jgi:hypothetical protein
MKRTWSGSVAVAVAQIVALFAALAPGACRRAAPPRAPGPGGAVALPDGPIEFGRAFPLSLTRVVRRGATAEPEPSLAPLTTRLEATTTWSGDDDVPEVVEERRYLAWAFVLDAVELPGASLHVTSSLPDGNAGRPELPEELLELPRSDRTTWIVALAAAIGAALLGLILRIVRRRERVDRSAAPSAERISADARARARLQQLRRRPLDDGAAVLALHDEASALLRDYLGERFEPSAPARTSEELLEDAALERAIGAAPRRRLVALLPPLDRVRFGRGRALPAAARQLVDELESFVGETSP